MRGSLPFPAPPITCTGSERPWVGQVHGSKTILGRQDGQGASCSMRLTAARRGRDHLFGCATFLIAVWCGANRADRRRARRRQEHWAMNPRAPVPPLLQASEHGPAPRSSRTADVERGNGHSGSVGDRRHETDRQPVHRMNDPSRRAGRPWDRTPWRGRGHGSSIFFRLTGQASVVSASPPRMRAV
jgi:hypothetical protein